MIHKKILMVTIAILTVLNSCKKDVTTPAHTSVNVINAIVEMESIKVNSFQRTITWASLNGADGIVNYAFNKVYTLYENNNDYPLTIISSADSLTTIFNSKVTFEPNGIYSLYTSGKAPNFDVLIYKEDSIPYNFADSAIAIRFINLSVNSPLIKINLASTPQINEVNQLNYQQQTSFKKYLFNNNVTNPYATFEIRDANTSALLASYTIPSSPIAPYTNISRSLSRFKSITLAIKGLSNLSTGKEAYGLFPITNY